MWRIACRLEVGNTGIVSPPFEFVLPYQRIPKPTSSRSVPKELRSEFQPIATAVPGIQVCEHLPRLARLMSHCALVRSVHHDQVAHAPAVYTAPAA